MDKKKVTLLYSGGWDGTFRLLQLAQYDIEIQPVYVIDKDRGSTEYECRAMKTIIEEAGKRFPAVICPSTTTTKNGSWKIAETRK